MKNSQENKIYDILEKTSIDIEWSHYLDFDEININNLSNDIRDQVEESQALDVEIIYYSNAIEYLSENDPSLQESMAMASEFGYDVANLNSEILASILASQKLRNDFYSNFPSSELNELELKFEEEEEEEAGRL